MADNRHAVMIRAGRALFLENLPVASTACFVNDNSCLYEIKQAFCSYSCFFSLF